MQRYRFNLFIMTLLLATTASAQSTYHWIDRSGKPVYSDQPPPPGVKIVATKEGKAASDDKALPYATRQAADKFPVTLYTTPSCTEACADARGLLNGRGIPFSEKMLKSQEEAAGLAKEQGGEARFPTIKVGPQSFVGFEAGAWTNLLDLAGYPKTAPYGSKPAGAFAK